MFTFTISVVPSFLAYFGGGPSCGVPRTPPLCPLAYPCTPALWQRSSASRSISSRALLLLPSVWCTAVLDACSFNELWEFVDQGQTL